MVELVNIAQEPEVQPQVPEKKEEPKVNMEFSTPIQDVMGAEFDEVMPEKNVRPGLESYMKRPDPIKDSEPIEKPTVPKETKSKNPFGLTDEQLQALIAGVSAVVAFSDPVQTKVVQFLPQAFAEGKTTPMGYLVMILLAGVIYMLIKKFAVTSR